MSWQLLEIERDAERDEPLTDEEVENQLEEAADMRWEAFIDQEAERCA